MVQTYEEGHGDLVGPGRFDMDGREIPPGLPVDYAERFQRITEGANFVDLVCAHVANGGTLISLAEMWRVRHSDIAAYFSMKPVPREKFKMALIARDEWEKERVLQELRNIATVDIREAYDKRGRLKNVKDIPANVAAAISAMESEEIEGADGEVVGVARKVKFIDKAKAIEMFMKKHGMLIDRHKVEVMTKLEDILEASLEDAVEAEVVPEPAVEAVAPEGTTETVAEAHEQKPV